MKSTITSMILLFTLCIMNVAYSQSNMSTMGNSGTFMGGIGIATIDDES